MKYRALVSFSGLISMSMGEEREIEDPAIVNDLLKAGYIQPTESGQARLSAVKIDSELANNELPAGQNKLTGNQSAARGGVEKGQKGSKRRKKNED